MKAGGRVRFFVTLTSILAATIVVGVIVSQTTFETLRQSYRTNLQRSVDQGVFLIEGFLENQFTLLALYASVPSVQAGQIGELPDWLRDPLPDGVNPRRLSILSAKGQGRASNGQIFQAGDRAYFLKAREGQKQVEGPLLSRVDGRRVVVVAVPVPGRHPQAAVVTASIDLTSFRILLEAIQGLSGADLSLTTADGQLLATTETTPHPVGGNSLESSQMVSSVGWKLRARVNVLDTFRPVQTIFMVVGALVLLGGGLVVVFYLVGIRHRRDLEQVRDDRTQALREAYEQIRKLAFHDTVTRLPNRNLVIRRVGEALQSAGDLVVVVLALGRFRNLTTTFGLHFGDVVLREASARLTAFGPSDQGYFLGRLGGSEFLLMIPAERYSPQTLSTIIRLFDAPMGTADLRLHVNVHIGACRLREAGETPEEVIKSAETALWAARDRGPNEACELDAEAVADRLRRAQLQKLLPDAWLRGEMEVHFQPQITLRTGVVAGYEGLLRWTSPELGQVSPVEFIPIAEETGVIVPLGFWILDRGIEFAMTLWKGGRPAIVSINVSAVQFLHHDFLQEITRRVSESGIPPCWMGLEITESALMEEIDQLRPALGQILEAGIKISLDDFGTGYSSLNYLRELPLNTLKIDKSFIQALDNDNKAYRLIECIIDLAHHLGLVVVAEGIETELQEAMLATVGCDMVQGFRTGRPQRAREHLDKAGL